MTLARFPELKKLPKRQRLKLAEELWFSGVDDSLPVGPAAKQVLEERWNAYRAGKAKRISLNELERRRRRKRSRRGGRSPTHGFTPSNSLTR